MNLSHIMLMNKNRVPKVCYSSRWQWQISCEPIRFLVNVSLAHSNWRWSVCSKRKFKVFLFRNWVTGLLQLHFTHHDCQKIFTGWEIRPWLKSSNKTPNTNFRFVSMRKNVRPLSGLVVNQSEPTTLFFMFRKFTHKSKIQ